MLQTLILTKGGIKMTGAVTKRGRNTSVDRANWDLWDLGNFGFFDWPTQRSHNILPAVDIVEDKDKYQITAELPGLNKDDISIELENGHLSISAERKESKEEEGATYIRKERRHSTFSRSFYVGDNVKTSDIDAEYKDGLLKLQLVKNVKKEKAAIKVK